MPLSPPPVASRFAVSRSASVAFASALLLVAGGRAVEAMLQVGPSVQFPTLVADAMDKSTVSLPAQLEGRQNLVVLSWARNQQAQVDSWIPAAQVLQHMHPDARAYTVLVSAPENILFRWWDNASLRAAQNDPELLHSTLALYTDTAALQHALGLPDQKEVAVLLLDRTGHVLWRSQGAMTEASHAALLAAANRVH